MTTITVTLTGACAGGEHISLAVTGDVSRTLSGSRANIAEPITPEEAEAFVKVLVKLVKLGRTMNQARNILQNGVTITV